MFTKISKDGVEKFLTRMFLPWSGNGRIRSTRDMVETIPDTFKNLMNNMYFLNDKIGKKIACQMTIDFSVKPKVSGNYKNENRFVESKEKIGGRLYIFSGGSFSKKRPTTSIEYGLYFDVQNDRKQKINCYYYCCISTKSYEEFRKEKASLKDLSNFQVSERKISNLIKNSLERCIEMSEMKHIKREFNATLKEF